MGNRAPVHRTIQNCSIYFQGVCPNNAARLPIHGVHGLCRVSARGNLPSCRSRIVSRSHFIEYYGGESHSCLGACNRNHHRHICRVHDKAHKSPTDLTRRARLAMPTSTTGAELLNHTQATPVAPSVRAMAHMWSPPRRLAGTAALSLCIALDPSRQSPQAGATVGWCCVTRTQTRCAHHIRNLCGMVCWLFV